MALVETRLADLLADPTVKDLARALMVLAKIEDDSRAIMALLWVIQVVMYGNLVEIHRTNPAAAVENRTIYAEMLAAAGSGMRGTDIARLAELVQIPLIPAPRRVQ